MTRRSAQIPDDPDGALILAYGAGDVAAASTLAERLAPRLLSYSARLLGDRDEAEDVVQETLVRLWRKAPQWQPGGARVLTWCYRVAGNLCTDRLRRRRRQAPLEATGDPADTRPGPVEDLTARERIGALDAALARLPERQAQAVILRHIEGLPNPDIAAAMDMTVSAVESLIARGKRALQADLATRREELGYEDDRS